MNLFVNLILSFTSKLWWCNAFASSLSSVAIWCHLPMWMIFPTKHDIRKIVANLGIEYHDVWLHWAPTVLVTQVWHVEHRALWDEGQDSYMPSSSTFRLIRANNSWKYDGRFLGGCCSSDTFWSSLRSTTMSWWRPSHCFSSKGWDYQGLGRLLVATWITWYPTTTLR